MILQPIKGIRHLLGIGCGEGRQWWRVGNDAVCDQCGVRVEGGGRMVLPFIVIDFIEYTTAGRARVTGVEGRHIVPDQKVSIRIPPGSTTLYIHCGEPGGPE